MNDFYNVFYGNSNVTNGGPAEGILPGDVLLEADRVTIEAFSTLKEYLFTKKNRRYSFHNDIFSRQYKIVRLTLMPIKEMSYADDPGLDPAPGLDPTPDSAPDPTPTPKTEE